VLAGLSVFAGPVASYLTQASEQVFDRDGYIGAVLGTAAEDQP